MFFVVALRVGVFSVWRSEYEIVCSFWGLALYLRGLLDFSLEAPL